MKAKKDITSVYNLYVDELFIYGHYLGFGKETVKDAIQDVFCKLAADEKVLSNVSHIKFFLFISLKNRLYDIHKSKKEHINLDNMEAAMLEMPFNIEVNVEHILIAEEEQQQIKREIQEMLNSLTDRQREIIYLRYVQEYDYDQISQLLNISVHGCRKLVSKAITSLRVKYGSLILLLLLP